MIFQKPTHIFRWFDSAHHRRAQYDFARGQSELSRRLCAGIFFFILILSSQLSSAQVTTVDRYVVGYGTVEPMKFMNDEMLYKEGWNNLAQPIFWQQVMSLSPDSGIVNLGATRQVLDKIYMKEWNKLSDLERGLYKDSVRKCNNIPDSVSLLVTGGKKEFYDFKVAKQGYIGPNGKKLVAKKGIEVGNIFQLGFHYSSKMKGANFRDSEGKEKPYYMGCYGIGLARTLAAVVEVYNDEHGIIWPENVAPYQVHLIGLGLENESVKSEAEKVYKLLQAEGIEVLFDDREDVSAGAKFADADLIGIPYRVVISKKTGEKLEVKKRSEKETQFKTLKQLIEILASN